MAFTITINYKNETYTSELIDDAELEDVNGLAENISKENVTSFGMQNGDHKYYFPKKVLQKSIITITKIK